MWQFGAPDGWFTGDGGDDSSRQITMIVLSSNDRLRITSATVHTSAEGQILNLIDHNVNGNSWDYTFTVQATEHFRAMVIAEVGVEELGDRSTVRCRIEDNGDKVDDDFARIAVHRTAAQVNCNYVS
jgi:hypothetical protein